MAETRAPFPAATLSNFEQIVLEASRDKPVLVDFWAEWCAPCKALEPILTQLSTELAERLSIVKVNADEQAGIAAQLAVRSLPTLMLFSDGQPVGQLVGAQPAANIMAMISPYLSSPADELITQAVALREQGKTDEARRLLSEALAIEPENSLALRALIPLCAVAGELGEARELHGRLLRTDRESSWGVALSTLIELAELGGGASPADTLQNELAENPGDSNARAGLAAQHILAGAHQQAMDELLELLRRDKAFADELPRRGLLAVFELEGEHSPLANEYRRKMAAALH